jgi:hypothetical protein
MIVTARSPAQRPIVYAPRGQRANPGSGDRTDNPAMPVPGLGLADDVFHPGCRLPDCAVSL